MNSQKGLVEIEMKGTENNKDSAILIRNTEGKSVKGGNLFSLLMILTRCCLRGRSY